MGNDQKSDGSSSSSSSKKNKNPSNSSNNNGNGNGNGNGEKPKQPQRGLGVAQLEKIRLHQQMASCGGFIPPHQFPPFPPPSFSPSPFQEDMRMQAGYHQAALAPYGFVPPPAAAYNHPNNFMMGFGEHMQRAGNIRFGESQPSMTPRWNPNNMVAMPDQNNQYTQHQGLVTRHLLSHVEQNSGRDSRVESNASSSHPIREEDEELDLELKL